MKSPQSKVVQYVAVVLVSVAVTAVSAFAAESAGAETESEGSKEADAKKSPAEEWSGLKARMFEIDDRVKTLTKEYATADEEGKNRIRVEFRTLVTEYDKQIRSRMHQLAATIYENNPSDLDAGEAVLEQAFQANQYEQVLAIAKKLMDAGRHSAVVLNIAGASHFALHDFEQAQEVLQRAEESGMLLAQLGGPYLEAAGEYIAFWKKEQEIRNREAAATGDDLLPRVTLETTRGSIVLELFENEAPNTVANFISLVEAQTYDGTKFHRVIPNFMVQGGDPNSKDDDPANDGQGGPGYTIKCECYGENARKHFRGSLSMAHAGRDTGGSQFFITHLPTAHLNQTPSPESVHTVFGRVVEGMDVVAASAVGDVIKQATVLRKRNHDYTPKTAARPTAPGAPKK